MQGNLVWPIRDREEYDTGVCVEDDDVIMGVVTQQEFKGYIANRDLSDIEDDRGIVD